MRFTFLMLFMVGLCLLSAGQPAFAQPAQDRQADQGSRRFDQEVVERLVRVEERLEALAAQIEGWGAALNQRIDDTNKRMNTLRTDTNSRFADLRTDMNARFTDLRADMNARFEDVMAQLQIITSALVALVLAVAGAGFVMWRKILAVDAAVQTKIGLDEVVREQMGRLERDVGFLQGKVRELESALEKR